MATSTHGKNWKENTTLKIILTYAVLRLRPR